jgi:hypothetical protein
MKDLFGTINQIRTSQTSHEYANMANKIFIKLSSLQPHNRLLTTTLLSPSTDHQNTRDVGCDDVAGV